MHETGYCQCECGQLTTIAIRTRTSLGYVKGQPNRFVTGHHIQAFVCGSALSTNPVYIAYCGAKQRCQNPKAKRYPYYGARGIEFRFNSFEQFYAELGERPEGMTLDRINNDGHYEPGNVKWSTWSEQAKNRRTEHSICQKGHKGFFTGRHHTEETKQKISATAAKRYTLDT
jgi:hypothetical protein